MKRKEFVDAWTSHIKDFDRLKLSFRSESNKEKIQKIQDDLMNFVKVASEEFEI